VSLFSSILIPLDGSPAAARGVGCATWLAARLSARLHVLSTTPHVLPAREELARLQIAEEHWPLVELHQGPAYAEASIVAAIIEHRAELVVTSAAATDVPELLDDVTRSVIEQTAARVLLLPPAYHEVLPWERALVPLSGGSESDDALVLAVRLAGAIDLTVYVAHVAEAATEATETLAAQARYSDALHHEYRSRWEELVVRALSRGDCRRVKHTALGSGDIASELLRRIEVDRIDVLIVGWHGQLATGRARILKQLISTTRTPMLLVRSSPHPEFRLEVGEVLE
jgi:nucleotide-binding universal stress UspA family protein